MVYERIVGTDWYNSTSEINKNVLQGFVEGKPYNAIIRSNLLTLWEFQCAKIDINAELSRMYPNAEEMPK